MKFNKNLKYLFTIITVILFVIIVVIFFNIDETIPEDKNDFQSVKEINLNLSIDSVQDGLPIALEYAREIRNDVMLSKIVIVSKGKEEIENRKGSINYYFEVSYIDEENHGGVISVTIDTNLNSITHIVASYDGKDKSRKVNELKINDFEDVINKIYNSAINSDSKEIVYGMDFPIVRVTINPDNAYFELGEYNNQILNILYSETLDM